MVHGMVKVHDITSTVHQVGHLMASKNRITCQLHQLHQLLQIHLCAQEILFPPYSEHISPVIKSELVGKVQSFAV